MYQKSQKFFARVILILLLFQNAEALFFDRNSAGSGSVSINTGGVTKSEGNTGALGYVYNINLPKGRSDMRPNIDLNYNSQLKNNQNWLGYGWDINIPKIERQNKTGVQNIYTDNNYKSNIYGELEWDNLKQIYTAKKNDMSKAEFKKVKLNTGENAGAEYFEVIDNVGKKYIYGNSINARMENVDNLNASSTDIYNWYLTEVVDEFGNSTNYEYVKDDGFVYPSKITYTNNRKMGLNGIYEVDFIYQDRADKMFSFATGYFTKNKKIVKSIEIYTVETENTNINKKIRHKYDFKYDTGVNGKRSLLATVTETGIAENGESKVLPETKFNYSKLEVEYKKIDIDKNNFDRIADINNDGLTDYVYARTHYLDKYEGGTKDDKYVWQNKGDFKFEKIIRDDLPYILSQEDDRSRRQESRPIYFADTDNDGLTDIIDKNGQGYLRINNMDGDNRPDINYEPNGNGNSTENIKLSAYNFLDLNGDGLDDEVYAKEAYEYLNLPLQKEKKAWINVGNKLVETTTETYALPPTYLFHLYNGYTVYNNLYVDLNADGLMDILGQDGKSYINDGENLNERYTGDIVLALFKGGYAADMNGDGLSEIVLDRGLQIQTGEIVNTWSPKQPSDILTTIKTQTGGEMNFEYKASAGTTHVWTLEKEKIQNINADGQIEISERKYNYEGGKIYKDTETIKNFDNIFAGFEKVEILEPNGLKTVKHYFQDEKFKLGKVKKQEIYDTDKLIKESVYEYVNKENYIKNIVTKDYEQGVSNKTYSEKHEYLYDGFGNIIKEIISGNEEGDKVKILENTYKQSINFPKKFLLIKNTIKDIKSVEMFGKSEYIYNDKDLLIETWKYTNANKKEIKKNIWDNDLGILIKTIGVNNAETNFVYDKNKMFIVEIINALGQSVKTDYDNYLQKEKLSLGVDGLQLKTEYESLGRVSKIYKNNNLLEENNYTDSLTENSVKNKKYLNLSDKSENSISTVIYRDKLGNIIKEDKQNWAGLNTTKTNYFDQMGNLIKEKKLNIVKNYKYDALGRVMENVSDLGIDKTIYGVREKTEIDKAGNIRKNNYDNFGNLIKVEENNKNNLGVSQIYSTQYEYDIRGNLLKIVDAENNLRNMTYDWLSRKTSDELSHKENTKVGKNNYLYNQENKYLEKVFENINGKQEKVRINFDNLGRKISEGGHIYIYDNCQNGLGKLCVASSSDGVITKYFYNSLGQIEKKEVAISGDKNIVNYKYDLAGQMLERGDGVATTTYKYKQNFLENIKLNYSDIVGNTNNASNTNKSLDIFNNLNYNDYDQLIAYDRGNLKTNNSYDETKINRLKNINSQLVNIMGTTTNKIIIQDTNYDYDMQSRISKIQNLNADKNYLYDDLGRLTKDNLQTFQYDKIGNLLNNSAKNLENQIWDERGRLTESLGDKPSLNTKYNYLWDNLSKLKEIKVASTTTFKYFYDTDGKRVLTLNYLNKGTRSQLISKLFTPNDFFQDTGTTTNWLFVVAGKPMVNLEKKKEMVTTEIVSTSTKKYSEVSKLNMKNLLEKVGFDKKPLKQNLEFKDLEIGKLQKLNIYFSQRYNNKDFEIRVASGTVATSSDKIFNFKGSEVNAFTKYSKATSTSIYFTPLTKDLTITIGDKYGLNNYFLPAYYETDFKMATITYAVTKKYENKVNTKLQNLITDHLNSVESILDFENGEVLSKNEFESFGKVKTMGENSSNIKYTGHEDDQKDIGLIYMGNRYHNPQLGKFISPDNLVENITAGSSLLNNPQALNAYSYAWNNPINAYDPDGKLTIIIPGTWYNAETWNTNNGLYLNAQATFNETPVLFNNRSQWSGGNNNNDRVLAGNNLADMVNDYNFANGEKLNIVAHSHGGNVAKIASHMLMGDRKIDNLITLGAPARNDYPTNTSRVNNMIEVYSNNDFVQSNAGNKYQLVAGAGYLVNRGRTPMYNGSMTLSESGPAARYENVNNAVNVTQFTTKTISGVQSHYDLYLENSVWGAAFKK